MARRRPGRHGRRIRRITPRRWLPFVALVAVIGGAVTVSMQEPEVDAGPTTVEVPSARLPVAAAPGAVSTAWYCAGGTGQGPDGPAELAVVIANADGDGARAEIVVQGSNGERRRTTVDVPANGRTRVVGSEILRSAWLAMTVEVVGGRAAVERDVRGPGGIDVSPCSTNASARWYVPSGSTVRGATEDLVLYNPFPDATSVDITFATDQGTRAPRALQGLSVPGRSLRVVPSSDLPARRPEIATRIAARTGRIVVDRVQIYDGTGDPVGGEGDGAVATPAPSGIASTPAIPSGATRWIFPQAEKVAGARTQVAVFNPSGRPAEIDVVLTYEEPDRFGEVEPVQVTVRASDAEVIDLTDLVEVDEGTPFTIDVRSLDGVNVVAEQLVFGATVPEDPSEPAGEGEAEEAPEGEADPDEGAGEEAPPEDGEADAPAVVAGFAVLAGSPVAASDWLAPGRGTSTGRRAELVVANPGTEAVTVRVTYLEAGERVDVEDATVSVPAGDRRVLDLAGVPGNPVLAIGATGPVVVGRSAVLVEGPGTARALATPLPDTVVTLRTPG